MTLPTSRRRSSTGALQPGDLAWLVAVAGLLLISFAATVGVGLACALFGRGWVWPHGVAGIARLLGGLLTGAPARALPAPARTGAPSSAAIYTLAALTVLITLIGLVVVVRWALDLFGAGGEHTGGFATRGQARAALSAAALPRRRVREIRPDLFETTGPNEASTSQEEM